MKTLVNLDDKQVKELDKLCKKLGWSRSEGVRKALTSFLKQDINTQQDNRKKALDSVFGIWKDNPMTDKDLEKLRKEWDENRF